MLSSQTPPICIHKLFDQDVSVSLWQIDNQLWAAYEGDESLLQKLATVEPIREIDGQFWRLLHGGIQTIRHDHPEVIGKQLLQTLPQWQAAGIGADPRWVIADDTTATWLIPRLTGASDLLVCQSVVWLHGEQDLRGTIPLLLQRAYGCLPSEQGSFAAALGWYERRRKQPTKVAPLAWLTIWIVLFIVNLVAWLTPARQGTVVPDVLGKNVTTAANILQTQNLRYQAAAPGIVVKQSPGAGSVVATETRIRLITNSVATIPVRPKP